MFLVEYIEQVLDQVDGQVEAAVGEEVLAGAVAVVDLAEEEVLLAEEGRVEVGKYCKKSNFLKCTLKNSPTFHK